MNTISSTKQRSARIRNFSVFRLRGMLSTLRSISCNLESIDGLSNDLEYNIQNAEGNILDIIEAIKGQTNE